jgi:protein-S-isoprenylcysteine O-methyltransferase Ste14
MTLIRVYYGVKSRRRGGCSWQVETEDIDREGRWSIFVRGILFLFMLLVVALYAINPDWFNRFAIPLPAWSRWFGAVLSAISIPFLIWVHYALNKEWSTNLRIRKEHQLVTSGPYQWVRHPMYCLLFTFFVGLTLLSSSWPVLALAALSIAFLYRRIGIEERMMLEHFGEEYRAYIQSTGRLLPLIGAGAYRDRN